MDLVTVLCLILLLSGVHGMVAEQRILDGRQFPAERPNMDTLISEFGWKPLRDISTAKLVN